jgi:LCP family protein required for cell wall assembly
VLVLSVLGVGAGYAYLQWRFDQIEKIDFAEGTLTDDDSDRPMNVLLVGSDTRENLTGLEAQQLGRDLVSGRRSDTIMVLHVDPASPKAVILSIPRDLWVTHADTGRKGRVNAVFDKGPQVLVETIRLNLGIDVNHYAEVDFLGFKGIVQSIGGVHLYLPAPVRDPVAGLNLPNAGCVNLIGDQALAWVRSRHFQTLENGRWKSDPTGDFGRIARQQDFIRRMMSRAIQKGIRNPLKADQLIEIGVENLIVDEDMSLGDIRRLAGRFRSLDPEAVETVTLPTRMTRINGASVLLLKEEEAQPIVDRLNGTAPPAATRTVRPAEVQVRVLNGSGVPGQSGQVASALQKAGFVPAGTGNAGTFGTARTVVRFRPEAQAEAELVQSWLLAGAELVPDGSVAGTDVVLVTGKDYRGVRGAAPAAAPAAPAGAPATTAPPTTAAAEPDPTQPPGPQC